MADATEQKRPGTVVRNLGEPIRLSDVKICGITTSAAKPGEKVTFLTRAAVTSYDPTFQTLVRSLAPAISNFAANAGHSVNLTTAETVLLVVHQDDAAELWVDTAAVTTDIVPKRNLKAGTLVLETDIADVVGMSFPLISISATDRVLCIFRVDWSFGLFFDFNDDKKLEPKEVSRTLGTLYRQLRYRQLYETISNEQVFSRLTAAGWFPFVEILGREFQDLFSHCEAEFDLPELEAKILANFDRKRLDQLLERWLRRPHLASKEKLLRAALDQFEANEPVAVIKIILTEIEGILGEAYRKTHGKPAKLKKLLDFAIHSATEKSGASDTLLLPAAFREHLANHTFANFDPMESSLATSRHSVGHGAADADSYTMTRALQAILTLDQLAFYT